jgi:hypothetical protein
MFFRVVLLFVLITASTPFAQETGWQFGALTIRNVAGVTAFDKQADLTYNPTVSSALSVSPSHTFSGGSAVRLGLGLSYEWTNPDFQTTRHEVWLSDPSVTISYPIFARGKRFRLGGSTTMVAPVSPTSRAASLITRIDQSVRVSTQLSNWSLSYSVKGTQLFHDFTTGQLEDARIGACSGDECLALVHTGVRNASWSNTHYLASNYAFTDQFSVSVSGGVILAGLYALTSTEGLPDEEGPSMRYLGTTRVAALFSPVKGCSIGTGVESFHAQLRPDGARQTALFNRYAQVFLDLMVTETCFGAGSKG